MGESEFRTWIKKVYTEWRGSDSSSATSMAAFGRYLGGISQPLMQRYLNPDPRGRTLMPTTTEVLEKFALRYPEIYEVVGLEDPLGSWPVDTRTRWRRVRNEVEKIAPFSEIDLKEIVDRLFEVESVISNDKPG